LLALLVGPNNSNLNYIEKALNVKLGLRGNIIIISANKDQSERVEGALLYLYKMLKKGIPVDHSAIDHAAQVVASAKNSTFGNHHRKNTEHYKSRNSRRDNRDSYQSDSAGEGAGKRGKPKSEHDDWHNDDVWKPATDKASGGIVTKKKTILPRNPNQKLYMQAIKESDVVFGIGPAGTGKTYMAVAQAVSEFLKKNVEKIILSRPAVEAGEHLGFFAG